MESTYFLPINSGNLGEYFSRALIVPQKYIKEPINDFQSLDIDNLIFSTNKKFTNTSDCSIEVILKSEEVALLRNSNNENLMLLNSPIPITRVVKILFYSKEKMVRTINLARSSSFIPERLLEVISKNNNDFINEISLKFDGNNEESNINNKIDKYNKFLGGFAFMRLGGANYMNYSKNYFTTLEFFNSVIAKQVDKVKKRLGLSDNFQGVFDDNNPEWKNWRNFVFGDYQKIVDELEKNKVSVKNNRFQQDIVKDDKKLYILSILANYGPERFKPNSVDSLIMALITNKISNDFKEAVTLFFGLHNGYRDLGKNYYLNNKTQLVKFELESKLDYYIIESVHNFVFNNKKSAEFDYLEDIIPSNTKYVNKKNYRTYKILDEDIIYGEKPIARIFNRFIKSTRLDKILNVLSSDFSKKNEIELTEEQKKKIENNFLSLIEKPFYEYLEDLEKEITEFYDKNITELESQVAKYKEEHKNLSLLLKDADRTLFDEIDTNGDGELSQTEIGTFMDKIIKAKKQLEAQSFSSKKDEDFPNDTKPVMQVQEETKKYTSQNDGIEYLHHLSKLNFTELKKEAKQQNISIPAKLGAKDKKGIQLLIDKIVEAKQMTNKSH